MSLVVVIWLFVSSRSDMLGEEHNSIEHGDVVKEETTWHCLASDHFVLRSHHGKKRWEEQCRVSVVVRNPPPLLDCFEPYLSVIKGCRKSWYSAIHEVGSDQHSWSHRFFNNIRCVNQSWEVEVEEEVLLKADRVQQNRLVVVQVEDIHFWKHEWFMSSLVVPSVPQIVHRGTRSPD